MDYEFNFFYVWRNFDQLLDGLTLSLQLTALAVLIGLTGGFIVALMRMSSIRVFSISASVFIEFFRCTPVLVQIVWSYYCLPLVFNIGISPFSTVLLALGLNLMAFNAEAYRGAIQSIPTAHFDACTALGLTSFSRTRFVILPQALRMAAPVLVTNAAGIFQQSALVSTVAIADLMYRGKMIASSTYRPVETLTVVALIYFAISFPLTQMVKIIEDNVAAKMGT